MSEHRGPRDTGPVKAVGKGRGRYVVGAGAAACAACCAVPVLAVLGIAGGGIAATLATMVFAGAAFGAVVLSATVLTLFLHRRRTAASACGTAPPGEPVVLGVPEPRPDER
ncbi:hypothetical protein [Nocardiopsis quinghaiensis]|uniref:hypothetical protein n=1 Tax=Nocardiopsis quinghaiensis TaxID=464995 RepID=UPI00123A9006|nr:hypothetical protein [Nocardiopsis quinghaiensis]